MTEEYQGTMRWFGRALNAPAWEGMPEVPTPVGSSCMHCGELIEETDVGITMPCGNADGTWTREPAHVECYLRSVLGSVEHMHGQCSCHTTNPTETNLSWRDQGRLLMQELDLERGYSI